VTTPHDTLQVIPDVLLTPPGTDMLLACTKDRQIVVWQYNPAAAHRWAPPPQLRLPPQVHVCVRSRWAACPAAYRAPSPQKAASCGAPTPRSSAAVLARANLLRTRRVFKGHASLVEGLIVTRLPAPSKSAALAELEVLRSRQGSMGGKSDDAGGEKLREGLRFHAPSPAADQVRRSCWVPAGQQVHEQR